MSMRFVGNGFLAGVPARDLTDEEVKLYGEALLLASGLYEKVEKRPAPRAVREKESE